MTVTDRADSTAAEVAERAFEILDHQAVLMRCCWNAMRSNLRAEAEITFRLAAMMSTVGAALENVPQIARDASRAVMDGRTSSGDRSWETCVLELDAGGAVDLLSTLTVDPLCYPGLPDGQWFYYGQVASSYKALCDCLAACAGVEPNYGVLGQSAVDAEAEPERWFVDALSREAGWLRRRSKSFRERVAYAWAMRGMFRGSLTSFGGEITSVRSSGGRSLKFIVKP